MKIFFEDAFEKIARIVTQQTGVQVRFEGMQPCTDGKVIVLPKLSKLPEDFNKDLLNGYLDHEAAHVIFTDMNVFKAELARDKFLKTVSNALEDIRIERKMGERFIGCKQNIRQMNDFHVSDIKKNFDKINPATQIAFAISLYGSGDAEPADFKGNARAALEIVKDDIDELPKCQNTGDVIELAKRIVAKLRDSAQQSEDGEGADIGDGQPKKDDKKDKKQQKKNQKGKGGKNQKGEEEQDEKTTAKTVKTARGQRTRRTRKSLKAKPATKTAMSLKIKPMTTREIKAAIQTIKTDKTMRTMFPMAQKAMTLGLTNLMKAMTRETKAAQAPAKAKAKKKRTPTFHL